MKKQYTLTQSMKDVLQTTGDLRCPNCGEVMERIKSNFEKFECYCPECRISIPLYDRGTGCQLI